MLEYGLNKSHSNIFSFSTTRYGGCSEGAYASFNCNDYCGDVLAHVARNQALLRSLLPGNPELVIPHQVHKTEIGIVDEAFLAMDPVARKRTLEGLDALVTASKGVCLCISTADCIPVLCYDERHEVVAAIHAGWRGTVARIVERTLTLMEERFGTQPADVHAVIGPGISLESFKVGDEVYEAFLSAGFDMPSIAKHYAKWHIDLPEANRLQLLAKGVCPDFIEMCGICTYLQQEDFFSARRLGIHSGRILSGIMMKK